MEAFDLCDYFRKYSETFILYPGTWEEFCCDEIDIKRVIWREAKFLNDEATELNSEMNSLPNDKGGIYLFLVKCTVLPDIANYLMYIGKAQITEGQNLRKRCREYFTKYCREVERPKIKQMVRKWGKYLYIKYLELEDNALIGRLEEKLIDSIVPPCNSKFEKKEIREATNAF